MNLDRQSPTTADRNIVIRLPDQELTATLEDNDDARAFLARLPLSLTLTDYAATEKVADLPSALPARNAAQGHTPRAGDIAYYAPWGNLAIYHKPFRHSPGLVLLGRLDEAGVKAMAQPGAVRVEIVGPNN